MTKEEKAKYDKQYRENNRDKLISEKRKYYRDNKKKCLDACKRYYENNKEKIKARTKQYYEDPHEKQLEYHRQYCKIHTEKRRDYDKKRRENNPEENKLRCKKYQLEHKKERSIYLKNRYETNIKFRLLINLRSIVRQALHGSTRAQSVRVLLGCSIEELKIYLAHQFQSEMDWSNHGLYGWHIDHIRPCASFDLTDPDQQKECFHYTNLQPLWALDNIRKGAKII